MKCRAAVGIVLLASIATLAQSPPTNSPTSLVFGDAHITVPPGWRHMETQAGANQAKVLLIVPPKATEKGSLAVLVSPGQDLQGAAFPQAFDTVLKKALAPNEQLVQYSELPVRKGADYDFVTRSMIVADEAGRRSVRICFGANPRQRLEMLIVSADSKETLQRYQAEVASLLGSYSFGDAPRPTDSNQEASGAAKPAARTDDQVPQEPRVTGETQGRAGAATGPSAPKPGARAHVPDEQSVLLCADPTRLDGAMDFAKAGDSYNALRALRNDAFFRVSGPSSLEVKKAELKSRWPKVLVTVLDGYFAGRTGWVVLSELKDLQPPSR